MRASTRSITQLAGDGSPFQLFEHMGASNDRMQQLCAVGAVGPSDPSDFVPPLLAGAPHLDKVMLLSEEQGRDWAGHVATHHAPAREEGGVVLFPTASGGGTPVWLYGAYLSDRPEVAVITFTSALALASAREEAAAASGHVPAFRDLHGERWATVEARSPAFEAAMLRLAAALPPARPPSFMLPSPSLAGDQQGRLTLRWRAATGPYDARSLVRRKGGAGGTTAHVHVGREAGRKRIKQLLSIPVTDHTDVVWEVVLRLEGMAGDSTADVRLTHLQYGRPSMAGEVVVVSDGVAGGQTITATLPRAHAPGTRVRFRFGPTASSSDLDSYGTALSTTTTTTLSHAVSGSPSAYYFNFQLFRGTRDGPDGSVPAHGMA